MQEDSEISCNAVFLGEQQLQQMWFLQWLRLDWNTLLIVLLIDWLLRCCELVEVWLQHLVLGSVKPGGHIQNCGKDLQQQQAH